MQENESMKEKARKQRLIRWRSYFHPAQISFTIGVIIFFAYFAILLAAFKTTPLWVTEAAYILMTFLLGLGGLVIIIRGEYINKDGNSERGCWAYVLGIFTLLFGWGLFAFLAYFTFFANSP